jgi:predicted ester cyclase
MISEIICQRGTCLGRKGSGLVRSAVWLLHRGNMRSDLYDHELEGYHKNDLQEGAQRLQVLMKQVPDLTVEVRDVIADGDKVVVRAVWFGTDAVSQRKVEFHGFVQWRIVEGKFAERWATVTPLAERRYA